MVEKGWLLFLAPTAQQINYVLLFGFPLSISNIYLSICLSNCICVEFGISLLFFFMFCLKKVGLNSFVKPVQSAHTLAIKKILRMRIIKFFKP